VPPSRALLELAPGLPAARARTLEEGT